MVERFIDSDENFLSEIFGAIGAGREAIREIVDAARVTLDNLFPGSAVARTAPPYQFRAFIGSQASDGSHLCFSDCRAFRNMSGVIARTRPSYVSLENKVPGLGTHASACWQAGGLRIEDQRFLARNIRLL